MKQLTASALKPLLTDGSEIAFLDVREHGQYGEGHPFFCVNLPFSKIERLAPRLLPRAGVRCVLLDDADGVAQRAARALEAVGFSDVSVLSGGAPAWAAAGYTLFKGVNVLSKTFGELVEHELGTPSISADELHELQEAGTGLVLLDGRSEPEFSKMSLPGARSCPNAELGYRVAALVDAADTTVIINCAGRTRSIIGAQTLRLLDLPNPVYALRNGTQGWRLAGYELDHGRAADSHHELGRAEWQQGHERAQELQAAFGIPTISLAEMSVLQSDPARSTYVFDVRTTAEYKAAHVDGARHAPGGQLVQATDEFMAVRNAQIVLSCDNGLRATTTAIWLAGMGHQVWVLDENAAGQVDCTPAPEPEPIASTIDAATLKARLEAGALVLDASSGMDYRDAHIDGAVWATRARLEPTGLGSIADLIIVGRCPVLIACIVDELKALTGTAPRDILHAGPAEWKAAGLHVISTPDQPSEHDCIDYLFFVHDRHDGNLDAARRYLEWETGLLEQLDEQERGVLKPPQRA